MIRVSQLKLPVEHNEEQFCQTTTLKRKTEERVFFRWDAWIKIQKAFF